MSSRRETREREAREREEQHNNGRELRHRNTGREVSGSSSIATKRMQAMYDQLGIGERKSKRNDSDQNSLDDQDEAKSRPTTAWFSEDIVWAKYPGYPYWPGMIVVIDNDLLEEELPKRPPRTHLVFFFAENNWSWVKESCLLPYGDSRLTEAYEEFHKARKPKPQQKLFETAIEIANRKWMEQLDVLEKSVKESNDPDGEPHCCKCAHNTSTRSRNRRSKEILRCADCKIDVCMNCVLEVGAKPKNTSNWLCGRCFVYHWRKLKNFLERAKAIDKRRAFWKPVDLEEVPDYIDFVKEPMDFTTISKALADFDYNSPEVLANDIRLICKNAMAYNAPDTVYYADAQELQNFVNENLSEFDEKLDYQPIIYEDLRGLPPLNIPALKEIIKASSDKEKEKERDNRDKDRDSDREKAEKERREKERDKEKRERERREREGEREREREKERERERETEKENTSPQSRSRKRKQEFEEEKDDDIEEGEERVQKKVWRNDNGWVVETMTGMKKLYDQVLKLQEQKGHIQSLMEENRELQYEIHHKNENILMLAEVIEQKDHELLNTKKLLLSKEKELETLKRLYDTQQGTNGAQ